MSDTSLVPAAGPGQPSKILKYGSKVLSFLEQGYPIKRSVELAGVSYQTHRDWYTRGERGQNALDGGGNPSSTEYIYIKYYNDFNAAQHSRRSLLADVIMSAAIGGEKIVETRRVQVTVDGQVVREEEQTTEKILPSDWRAALSYLKMMHRDDWHTRTDQTVSTTVSPQEALTQALSGMDEQSKQIALRNLALVAGLSDDDKEAEPAIEGEFEPIEEPEEEDAETWQ